MISLAEVARGLFGAYRLARRDPGGIALFDDSPRGYWRSFWAAAVAAPAFLILDAATGGFGQGFGPRQAMIQAIAYVIDWTAFPLVMIGVADALGKWPRYMRYIVAYNWAAVLQIALLLPLALMAVAFPSPPTLILAQVAGVVMLVYRAYVAHVALQVGFGMAAAIVLLDVLLSGFLKGLSDSLMAM
jgi:hypothetical protein